MENAGSANVQILAGVEGGGTKWRVALGRRVANQSSPFEIFDQETFETTSPQETLSNVRNWLVSRSTRYSALGIACFGPVDLDPNSKTYGFITTTPKPGWQNVSVLGVLDPKDGRPVIFDTDVNGPAMAEFKYNNPPNTTSCAYITVGTGVGVGLVVNSKTVHGLVHPEGGHILVPFNPPSTTFRGACPFHSNCVEGLAASYSIAARINHDASSASFNSENDAHMNKTSLSSIDDGHPVWDDQVSFSLAYLCASLVCLVSPHRIVISGGVMNRRLLLPLIRQKTLQLLNGYISSDRLNQESYIDSSPWGNDAGIFGALALADSSFDST